MKASYSGIDITVVIDGEKNYKVQSLTTSRYKTDDEWLITGSLKLLLLTDGAGKLKDHIKELKVIGANEYGQAVCLYTLRDVEITGWSCNMTIDQVVTEEYYDFVAKTFVEGESITLKPKAVETTGEVVQAHGSVPRGLCDIAIALTEKSPGEQLRLITLREIFEEKP